MAKRTLTLVDQLVLGADSLVRALSSDGPSRVSKSQTPRPNPGDTVESTTLKKDDAETAARLMRVNHAGEVAAQALYHGQAAVARSEQVRAKLNEAAAEEADHLAWCRERLTELGATTSRLDPLWYAGSYLIGMAAGMAGDAISLGFIAETERQVVEHLEGHLDRLPDDDSRSRAILEQMKDDEARHGNDALESGGQELPEPVPLVMRGIARIMTGTAYWV